MAIPATFCRWAIGILLGLGCIAGPATAQTQLLARQSLPTPKSQQGAMRPVARISAGITDDEKLGFSSELAFMLFQKKELEAAVSFVYLAPPPCPVDTDPVQPDGGDPCPEGTGSEYIAHLMASVHLLLVKPLSLRAGLGGGAAFGGAAASDDDSALAAEKRTAPTLAYSVAADVAISSRIAFFAQYRGFSIFTGERTFSGSNASTTLDIGTENKHLLSVGIGVRL